MAEEETKSPGDQLFELAQSLGIEAHRVRDIDLRDDETKLDDYLRLKEPWRYED